MATRRTPNGSRTPAMTCRACWVTETVASRRVRPDGRPARIDARLGPAPGVARVRWPGCTAHPPYGPPDAARPARRADRRGRPRGGHAAAIAGLVRRSRRFCGPALPGGVADLAAGLRVRGVRGLFAGGAGPLPGAAAAQRTARPVAGCRRQPGLGGTGRAVVAGGVDSARSPRSRTAAATVPPLR